MANKIQWYGKQCHAQITSEMSRRIMACAILLSVEVKRMLSVAGTGKVGKKKVYNVNPSAPGEAPHKQYGHLRRSIAWQMASSLVARVGTNIPYGRNLELGTRKMAARPFLRPGLAKLRDRFRAILGKPMN